MRIFWGCGITHNYLARAEPYLVSLRKHEPERATLWTVDFHPGQDVGMRRIHVDYSRCLAQPKWMLQSGGHVLFPPPSCQPDDIIVFTDADAVLQRPISPAEQDLLVRGTLGGGVMIGRNRPDPKQTLADEGAALFPKVGRDVLARRFPGHEQMLCANTGCVAATFATWQRLYQGVCAVWPAVDASFGHYAAVQWAICYVVQTDPELRLEDMPLSMHSHGHHGLAPGVHREGDLWMAGNEVVLFAHAL